MYFGFRANAVADTEKSTVFISGLVTQHVYVCMPAFQLSTTLVGMSNWLLEFLYLALHRFLLTLTSAPSRHTVDDQIQTNTEVLS